MNLRPLLIATLLYGSLSFSLQAYSATNENTNASATKKNVTNQKTYSTTNADPNYAATTATKTEATTPEDDAIITRSVKTLISNSGVLSKLPVEVTTQKGVVHLSGNVDSNSQASSLVALAESIVGVADVDTSKLTIKGSQNILSDSIITAKIKGLFIREDLFGEKDIASVNTRVETVDGVVYLTGIVDNEEQVNNALEIIKKSVPGIKRVEYKISKPPAAPTR